MSRVYVYLSFFKEYKIDYIYKPDSSIIEFACPSCQNLTSMSCETSNWKCTNCSQFGNIIHLIEFIKKGGTFSSIFVPRKEERSIFQILERLSKKYPNEPNLDILKSRLREIIKYYKKNTVVKK